MSKFLIYLIFIILYGIVTFFGLGPVIFADGSNIERLLTLLVVIAIYIILTIVFRFIFKKIKVTK